MTQETITTWTCERCGAQEQTKQDSRLRAPKGWIEVGFTALLSKHQETIGHLCDPCGGFFVSFVHGTLEEDLEAAAHLAEANRNLNAELLWSGADLRRSRRRVRNLLYSSRWVGELDEEGEEEDDDY